MHVVKVGKFGNRNIHFANNIALAPQGANSPVKKMWWGTVTKLTAAAATQRLNIRGATWGFEWVEHCEIHSRSYHPGGTYEGDLRGTVCFYTNIGPTVSLPATLGIGTKCILMRVWGR
jgi:hypothetical protein